jgi:hypothetical protein
MRKFIQLKDSIGWAVINTVGHTEGIEVFGEEAEQYIGKLYEDGNWSDISKIKYAKIKQNGTIEEILFTYYPSEVEDNIIMPDDADETWRYINSEWTKPV